MTGMFDGPNRVNQNWIPPLDVWETESDVVYSFDMPGIPEGTISIEVSDGTLTVSAERQKVEEISEERYYRFERRFGTFSRAVGLPQGVDESKISASYRDGVLEIRVPKPEEQKPRKIQLSKTVEGAPSTN
jgi:HSP20 family protein